RPSGIFITGTPFPGDGVILDTTTSLTREATFTKDATVAMELWALTPDLETWEVLVSPCWGIIQIPTCQHRLSNPFRPSLKQSQPNMVSTLWDHLCSVEKCVPTCWATATL